MVTLDNWQRIEKLVKWTGLSVNAFARSIGLNRGENLYQIKRGNNGISKELADLITSKYITVSKAWVLTGEGDMFVEDVAKQQNVTVPYYKMDAVQFVLSKEYIAPTYHIFVPMFSGCDFAALSFGAAMNPEIPQGAIVLCRKAETNNILPGENYLIVSGPFNGIRCIRKDPDSTRVRLVPKNKEDYDEISIEQKEIKRLYLIKGIIINKSV